MKKVLFFIFVFIIVPMSIFCESYRFAPGEYYILDGRLNVRSEPNLSGKVIGSLNINTKVNIIECAFNEQIIDNVSAYWYKISYNNSYGYIWGGFIAVGTFVYDIDSNGVKDYFHYRVTKIENHLNIIHINNDTFIYINNKRIKSNFVWTANSRPPSLTFFNECRISIFEGGGQDPRNISQDWVAFEFVLLNSNSENIGSIYFGIDKFGNIAPERGSW